MKIIIYGKEKKAIRLVEDELETLPGFGIVTAYSIESKNAEISIADYLDVIGTGEKGITGIIFAGICPPNEIIQARNANLTMLSILMNEPIDKRIGCIIGKTQNYESIEHLRLDLIRLLTECKKESNNVISMPQIA